MSQALSLYLHIPFCRSLCSYCAFNTYAGMDDAIPPFVDALIQEIHIVGQSQPGTHLKTIFFGGGTPSLLTASQFDHIFAAIQQSFMILADAEISLESNPNDLTPGYLQALRAAGFNRISIGMQSANPRELTLFKRCHDVQMVIDAVGNARQAGFDNLNLDLIFAIPHQTLSNWESTLQTALTLSPEHFSLYGLELKGGTPLRLAVDAGTLPVPDDDLGADMYEMATDYLHHADYEQYEISNWSRPGYQAQHNLQYWYNLPYLGLGPGAHGYAANVRYTVITLPQRYINALKDSDKPDYEFPYSPATAKVTPIDRETEISETIMMNLRLLQTGVQRAEFEARFGVDIITLRANAIQKFVSYGLLTVDEQSVRLTDAGRFVSNQILSELI